MNDHKFVFLMWKWDVVLAEAINIGTVETEEDAMRYQRKNENTETHIYWEKLPKLKI